MQNSDVLYLTSRSIEQCQPEQKQNHQKIEKLMESKLNKNILIAKTLKPLNLRQSFFPSKIPIAKICSKPIFVFEIGPVIYLQVLKDIHWPLKID